MGDHRRSFIDREPDGFPREFRLAEHHRPALQRPGIFHFGQIQVGVAVDRRILLRPEIIVFATMFEVGGVEGETVDMGINSAFFLPLSGQRVGSAAFQSKHSVLEQAIGNLRAMGCGEV
ncbi:hypothetical protein D3C78_1048370 [compost metagenome]